MNLRPPRYQRGAHTGPGSWSSSRAGGTRTRDSLLPKQVGWPLPYNPLRTRPRTRTGMPRRARRSERRASTWFRQAGPLHRSSGWPASNRLSPAWHAGARPHALHPRAQVHRRAGSWSDGVSNPTRPACKAGLDTCPRPEVPTEGVEPSRPEGHRALNAARLPVPAGGSVRALGGSRTHTPLGRRSLKAVRLPVPPREPGYPQPGSNRRPPG